MTVLPRVRIGPPAHGGHCVARVDGQVVFVRHTAPGEVVDVRITQRRSRFWRGEAVTVHEPAAQRVPSVWPEAGPGGVGGAELSHLSLPGQLEWKTQVLHETMRRIGGTDLARLGLGATVVTGTDAGDGDRETGTRTRIGLVVDERGDAAMYRHRSHDLVAVKELPLAVPEITALDLLTPGRWRGLAPGTRLSAVAPSAGPPAVLAGAELIHGRSRYVREQVMWRGHRLGYRVAAGGFWQVHRAAPQVLLDAVLAAADPQPGYRVAELYSGAGLFSLPLARAVGADGRLDTLEGSHAAVRDARRNLHAEPWARLHEGAVAPEALATLGRRDVVVLDPPRAGAGEAVMAALVAQHPGRIVYVACDPAALARDTAVALARGYRLVDLVALDLFPHTHHLEAVATLEPGPRGLTTPHKVS